LNLATIPQGVYLTAIALLMLGVICSAYMAWQIQRTPPKMAVMRFVWPLCALFAGPLLIWFYHLYAGIEASDTPFAAKVAKGTLHCGAGCSLADLICENVAHIAPGVLTFFGMGTIFETEIFAQWMMDYVFALLIGIVFQYFAIAPMRDLSVGEGILAATKADDMVSEGRKLAKIADNVTIKVPMTEAGIQACKALSYDGTSVNVTLCFSSAQAILAAKAGAAFISPFVGRLDDIGQDGMGLIEEICEIYSNYDFDTEVLVASVRHPMHVVDAARMGADVATVPPSVLRQMFKHPLTDKGLQAFLEDWKKTGQSIL